MASIREIAKSVGVSPATVSRAINNNPRVTADVRKRILAAMNKHRYVPTVGRKSTTNIAFVYTGESSLGSPFDAELMRGMSERMDEFGFDLLVLGTQRAQLPDETFTQMCVRKGIRGAVLRTTASSRHLCHHIAAEGFPAVVLGDRFDDPLVNSVYCDSRVGSRDAVEYLLGLGHRQIAVVVNVVDDSDHADRIAGYREAIEAAGMTVDERMIYRIPANRDGGAQFMRRIHAMPGRPTAVYMTDPMAAAGAIGESQRLGLRIPQDLSIVGFDDGDLRFLVHPQMTSVCQEAAALGRIAFEVLHDLLQNPGKPAGIHQVLRTTFEIHGSAAPPAKDAV